MKLLDWMRENNAWEFDLIESTEGTSNDILLSVSRVNKPGYHTHDGIDHHPVATKHPIPTITSVNPTSPPSMYANNSGYVMDCDSPKCEGGKYKLANGNYNICYRCNGQGWINETKHLRNKQYDNQKSK